MLEPTKYETDYNRLILGELLIKIKYFNFHHNSRVFTLKLFNIY